MNGYRADLESAFLRICRERGPEWIESVIRPLRLSGPHVSVRNIPLNALIAIVGQFCNERRPVHRVPVR